MPESATQPAPRLNASIVLIVMMVFFGVALPAFTLFFELGTRMCSESYINPVPSPLYGLLIALVPAAGIMTIKALKRGTTTLSDPACFILGAAVAVSAIYALVFLPIALFAVVAILMAGLGLLPLAPILSFLCLVIAAIVFMRRDKRTIAKIFIGFCAAAAVFGVTQLSTTFTRQCMQEAIKGKTPEQRHAAVRLLRALGNRDTMLKDCYAGWFRNGVDDVASAFLMKSDYFSDQDARRLFYQVTGQPFNSFARPGWMGNNWGSRFDADVAGTQVGGKADGLSLASSNITGKADFNESLGQIDWTMTFANDSDRQQEARVEVAMPPDAVVDGAWLWVNGEQRPAVFGEKRKVRQAYESVVSRKRDPLLVTSAGTDRVLVQCFPVPPAQQLQKGSMKIKLSMSVPLQYNRDGSEWMVLPRLAEKNFAVETKHEVDLQLANAERTTPSSKDLHSGQNGRLTGSVPDAEFNAFKAVVTAAPTSTTDRYFAALSKGNGYAVRTIGKREAICARHLYIVIDGGVSMKDYLPQVADALKIVSNNPNAKVIFASDEVSRLLSNGGECIALSEGLKELSTAPCLGGPDNLPAIEAARGLAKKQDSAAILWIHGPQPIKPEAHFYGAKEQHPPTALIDFEVEAGPNKVGESLKECEDLRVIRVARRGTLKDDLTDCLGRFNESAEPLPVVQFEDTKTLPAVHTLESQEADSLKSLWAAQETDRLLNAGDEAAATLLAAKSQIITPVSGAVVLETEEDYKNAGLDPKTPEKNVSFNLASGVTVPEADTPWLVAIAMLLLAATWMIRQRRALSDS